MDFLDMDILLRVFKLLDNPADLARAESVCRAWYRYIRDESDLWREMCCSMYPELRPNFRCICRSDRCFNELGFKQISDGNGSQVINEHIASKSCVWRELLFQLLRQPRQQTCILEPLHASSTDNYPQESIAQTLYEDPHYGEEGLPSYWSSRGEANTEIPETLTYRLLPDICVVHAVQIRPFLAFFQDGNPIYSSRKVRFRFGYCRSLHSPVTGILGWLSDSPAKLNLNDCIWTYESPAFLMDQDDTLQTFKLPKPTICFGGVFQIEFMGRVQTQQIDNLYYICIASVIVIGNPLLDFKLNITENGGRYILKHLCKKTKVNKNNSANPYSRSITQLLPLIQRIEMRRPGLSNPYLLEIFLQNLQFAGLQIPEDDVDD